MESLVGRRRELEFGIAAVRRSGGVVFSGESGVGKTALLTHLTTRLRRAGRQVFELHPAQATRHLSLWPFFHLVATDHPPGRDALVAEVRTQLSNPADQPPVVVVDDAHQLDCDSIALLAELLVDTSFTALATVRNGEELPDGLDRLWAAVGASEFEVLPLDDASGAALMTNFLEGTPSEELVREVSEIARGNALLTREVLLDAIDQGQVIRGGEVWSVREDLDGIAIDPGEHTSRVVERRLARLDDTAIALMRMVAVADRLRLDRVPRHLRGAVSVLEDRHLLARQPIEDGKAVVVIQPVVGEVTRSSMPNSARWSILAELIEVVRNDRTRRRGDAVRVASWAREAGLTLEVGEWVAAAREALSSFDIDAALAYARAAVTLDDTDHDAHRSLGEVLRLRGDLHQAASAFRTAVATAISDDDIVATAIDHGSLVGFQLGDPAEAMTILATAAHRVNDPTKVAALRSEAGIMGTLLGRFEDVLATRPTPSEMEATEPEIRWQLGVNQVYACAMLGLSADIDQLVDQTRSSFEAVASERPHEFDLLMGLNGWVRLQQGELQRGIAELEANLVLKRERGEYRGITAAMLALLMELVEDPRAQATAAEAVNQHRWLDPFGSAPIAMAAHMMTSCSAGAVDEVSCRFTAEYEDVAGSEPWTSIWMGRVEARLAWENGRDEEAIALCLNAAQVAVAANHHAYAVVTAHDAVTYGAADQALPMLVDSVGHTEGSTLLQVLVDHAKGVVVGDPHQVGQAMERLVDMSAWRLAAHAAAHQAAILADQGQLAAAVRAHAISRLLAAQLQGGRVVDAGEIDGALSDRQVEIAAAAAAGKPSREIADEAYVSVRTVDNHLHTVYRSLGINGRGELASALGEVPERLGANRR